MGKYSVWFSVTGIDRIGGRQEEARGLCKPGMSVRQAPESTGSLTGQVKILHKIGCCNGSCNRSMATLFVRGWLAVFRIVLGDVLQSV